MLGEGVQRPNLSRNLTNYWNRSYRLVLCAAHLPRGPVLVYGTGPFAPCEACLAVRPWTGGTEHKAQGLPMEGFGSAFFILFCGFDHDRNGRAGKGGSRRRSYSHALVCAGTRGMRGGRQQGHQRRPTPRPPGWHKRRRGATLVAHAGPKLSSEWWASGAWPRKPRALRGPRAHRARPWGPSLRGLCYVVARAHRARPRGPGYGGLDGVQGAA